MRNSARDFAAHDVHNNTRTQQQQRAEARTVHSKGHIHTAGLLWDYYTICKCSRAQPRIIKHWEKIIEKMNWINFKNPLSSIEKSILVRFFFFSYHSCHFTLCAVLRCVQAQFMCCRPWKSITKPEKKRKQKKKKIVRVFFYNTRTRRSSNSFPPQSVQEEEKTT